MRIIPTLVSPTNYSYLIIDDQGGSGSGALPAAIVDPYVVAKAVKPIEQLETEEGTKLDLTQILTTHHHRDHAGGNTETANYLEGNAKGSKIKVYGGSDAVQGLTDKVYKDVIPVGNLKVQAIPTPCHTQDSICYYIEDEKTKQRAVFTGDTLFIGGCGRFFEGTSEEMVKALETLVALPGDTVVYNGHEYTKDNVKFAESIDPENAAIQKLKDLTEKEKVTTGKTTISDEKDWNVFIRLDSDAVRKAAGTHDRVKAMGWLRESKNSGNYTQ